MIRFTARPTPSPASDPLHWPPRLLRSRDGGVTPRPTLWNWIGMGTMGMTLVAAMIAMPRLFEEAAGATTPMPGRLFYVGLLVYGASLTVGLWLVRPRDPARRRFGMLLAPVLIQIAVFCVLWTRLAAQSLLDQSLLEPALLEPGRAPGSLGQNPLVLAALLLWLAGCVLWLPLLGRTRRPGLLVSAEVAGPFLCALLF